MTLDKIIVTIMGIMGIGFTYWFFLAKKPARIGYAKGVAGGEKEFSVSDSIGSTDSLQIDIIVDGGYSPNVISISKNKTTKLNFIRKDPNSCLEEVVLGDFKIKKYLPLNQKITIEITPQESGEFIYSCGMNMFHGKIIVK